MTQASQVLKHLRKRKTLTSVEAIGLYGITRLAAVVSTLKKRGYPVHTKLKKGVRSSYAEYSLRTQQAN